VTPEGELRVQIAQTAAFVNTRPVDIVFIPMTMAGDGSGGRKKTASTPRPPQRMRFVEQSDNISATEIGSQYSQVATLLGVPVVVMKVNDEFQWDGDTWLVHDIQFPNEWSIRATVLRYNRVR